MDGYWLCSPVGLCAVERYLVSPLKKRGALGLFIVVLPVAVN